jgi:hypothetical protein
MKGILRLADPDVILVANNKNYMVAGQEDEDLKTSIEAMGVKDVDKTLMKLFDKGSVSIDVKSVSSLKPYNKKTESVNSALIASIFRPENKRPDGTLKEVLVKDFKMRSLLEASSLPSVKSMRAKIEGSGDFKIYIDIKDSESAKLGKINNIAKKFQLKQISVHHGTDGTNTYIFGWVGELSNADFVFDTVKAAFKKIGINIGQMDPADESISSYPKPHEGLKKCPTCKGSGQTKNKKDKCDTCGGGGYLPDDVSRKHESV